MSTTVITKCDKLDTTYTFRIPEITKKLVDKMPDKHKRILHDELLETIAKRIHMSKFESSLYLSTE